MKDMSNFQRVCLINAIAGNTQLTDWVGLHSQARINLSEANELMYAADDKNLEEYVDAAADNLVTAYGALFRVGVDAELIMQEVCESLLTRFDTTEEDALKTKKKYHDIGVETFTRDYVDGNMTYRVTISSKDQTDKYGNDYPEGKFLKSHKYRKPNLMQLIPSAVIRRLDVWNPVIHVQV